MHKRPPTFGSELRRLRIEAGKTLADVAEVMGEVSIPYVSDIERNRRNPPPRRIIAAILKMLGYPHELNRMCGLAVQFRGDIRLSPKTDEERELLVALERELEAGNLTRDAAKKVLLLLNGTRTKKGKGEL